MISLRRAISISSENECNIPRYHSNCTAVSCRTPQAPKEAVCLHAAITDEVYSDTADSVCFLPISSEATNHRCTLSGSHRRTHLPPPHSLCKALADTLPVNAFIYYIISYPDIICQYICANFSLFSQSQPQKITAYFSGSYRKWSWAARRGRRSHADIYTVRYAI